MKWFSRLKIYKNSTGSLVYNPETIEAWSFGHWKFLTKFKKRTIINKYYYSSKTSKHQRDVFGHINYKSDLSLFLTRISLDNPTLALTDEIKCLKYEIEVLKKLIKKPRTHRITNDNRKGHIQYFLKRIDKISYILREDAFDAFMKEELS